MTATRNTKSTGRASISMAQRAVYHLLKHLGPSTDADLVKLYDAGRSFLTRGHRYAAQTPSGIRTRRSELVKLGYVVKTDDTVRSAHGRKATIWRAV